MKEIIDKLDSIKIEHFCSEKNTVKKMRKQATRTTDSSKLDSILDTTILVVVCLLESVNQHWHTIITQSP